ncbi:MAG: nucleotidyltransferase domain-containing protein [Candidatus Lutacidiplasmatales archaeon]
MKAVRLPTLRCYRCVYAWTPAHSPVRLCPRCKSHLWDVPKIRRVRLGRGLGIDEILLPHRAGILRLARKHGARRVRVYGSVRRREADSRSDVDLLVDWNQTAPPLAGLRLEIALQELLGRDVSVAEEATLPWWFRPQVLAEAVEW